ncbi:MAG: ELWxxDGT repeat protein [Planctomycetota bacterium]|jgi:ELWxxDGT repeat protein
MPSCLRKSWCACVILTAATLPSQASLLKDITAGPSSSLPARFVHVHGTVFFSAAEAVNGHALWKTDGTPAGTVLVKDFFPGPGGGVQPRELTGLGGLLVCYADDSVNGAELWASDGTTKGTYMIKDINPGNQGRPVYMDPPTNLTVWKGKIYFSARNGTHGRELWVTDGTAAGTRMVADIYKGNNYSDSLPSYLTPVGNTLFFFAFEPTTGWELWKTDGTGSGTSLVKDVWPGKEPTLMTHNKFPFATGILNGNTLLFAAPNAKHGYELWKSDGTTAGTVLVKDMNVGTGHSYFSRNFCQAGPYVFYTATDGINGKELWRTDGTAKGTAMVKNIRPGAADSSPGWMVAFGNKVIFDADDGVRGRELWISDGTAAGTTLFLEIRPGSGSGLAPNLYSHFHKVGDRFAYFTADDGVRGHELWRTDGTVAGTTLVADVWTGSGSSYPEFFTLSGGKLVFRARDGVSGQEPRVLFPGATAQVVGEGSSPSGFAPWIRATDPVLGSNIKIQGRASVIGKTNTVLVGLPAKPFTWPLGPSLYLDANKFLIPLRQVTSTTRAWSTLAVVPNDSNLIGYTFGLQAYQARPGTALGFDATNGLVMTGGR